MSADFTGMTLDNILISKISDRVGTVKQSMLGPVDFNNENPGTWLLMNGQSCSGTYYEALTGNSLVPDMVTEGTFLRQAKSGRGLGSFEGDEFGSHTHIQNAHNHTQNAHTHTQNSHTHTYSNATKKDQQNAVDDGYSHTYAGWQGTTTSTSGATTAINQNTTATNNAFTATNQNSGGAETRPKNTAVNFYIKVSY